MRPIDADALLARIDDLYPPAPGALAMVWEVCKIIREAPTIDTQPEERKVYVVTSGAYSDYHIVAIFAHEEDAEQFTKRHNAAHGHYDQANIEVQDLEATSSARDCEPIMVAYDVDDDYAMTFTKGESDYHVVYSDMFYTIENHGKTTRLFVFMLDVGEHYSTNHEKITKIAQDRWAAYRARKEGL